MRPSGYHNVQFKNTTEKQRAGWDEIKTSKDMSSLTRLRMLISRLRITQPRKPIESQEDYTDRLGEYLHQNNRSHLGFMETLKVVDQWLWGALRERRNEPTGSQ